MKIFGIGIRQLRNRLQSPNFPEYISKHRLKEEDSNKRRNVLDTPCIVAGVEYKSAGSASRALGITRYEMKCRYYISPGIPKKSGRTS